MPLAEFCHWWKIDYVIDDDLQTHDDENIDDKKERIVKRLTNENAPFSTPLSIVVNWAFQLSRPNHCSVFSRT